MKKALLILFTGLSFVSFGQSAAPSPITLQKGQSIMVTSISESNLNMGMEMKNSSTSTVKIDVMDVTEKGFRISKTLVKTKTAMEFMGQEMKYDSEKPDESDEELSKRMSEEIGKSEFGTLDKSTGIYTPDKKDEEDGGNPLESFMGSNSQNELGAVFLVPVGKKVGETWKETKTEEGLKAEVNYTLKSVSGNEASVDFTGTMEMQKEQEMQNMPIKIEMSSKTTGSLVVDMGKGLLKSRNSKDTIDGSMEAMGQRTPVSGEVTTTTTYSY